MIMLLRPLAIKLKEEKTRHKEFKALSNNTNTPISELAMKLIDMGLKHVEVREETVVRKTLVFKE